MRKSKFSNEDKQKIIEEAQSPKNTITEVCRKYGITIATYYTWKKAPSKSIQSELKEASLKSESDENMTLRRLYINLSAHNYELAQFLDKQ